MQKESPLQHCRKGLLSLCFFVLMQPKNDEEEKQKKEGSKNIQKGQQVIGWLVEGVQQGGNQGAQQKASP